MTVAEAKDVTEEIVVKQQPHEQTQAPTAQIEGQEKKPDETITATTQVQEQEQPTFQATSSVTHPDEVIISIESKNERSFLSEYFSNKRSKWKQ